MAVTLVQTRRKKEAVAAECRDCNWRAVEKFWPWPLVKSVGLHEMGSGHRRFLFWALPAGQTH